MHWSKKDCLGRDGHVVDNQGSCHCCGADQVPDRLWGVYTFENTLIHVFSTIERATDFLLYSGHDAQIRVIPVDEWEHKLSLGDMLKEQLNGSYDETDAVDGYTGHSSGLDWD
jgi:hypothetical protein